ncbi:MAG: right-handed parallel beta-helix repeat-containing protein [Candidatus Aenigmarchaeota archaeon]|nr:right-handed parallel beta-helix repeat-containing protein [Candidatus Aenigmarchaeota archaeon]
MNPTRYDWNTLHIEKGEISYAEIRDYRAMDLRTGSRLSNSQLHNVGECPICIHSSSDIIVENNWVHDSGHEVVDISDSSPRLINNRFGPSPRFQNPGGHKAGWGGIIVGSGFPEIKNNTIEGFDDAVSFFNGESYRMLGEQILKENIFKDNVENVMFNPKPD